MHGSKPSLRKSFASHLVVIFCASYMFSFELSHLPTPHEVSGFYFSLIYCQSVPVGKSYTGVLEYNKISCFARKEHSECSASDISDSVSLKHTCKIIYGVPKSVHCN